MNIRNRIGIAGIWIGIAVTSFKISDTDTLFGLTILGILATCYLIYCDKYEEEQ